MTKHPAKCRHQLYLDPAISARLETLAAEPGASKSSILADALQAWLNRRGAHELDDRFGLRLARVSKGIRKLEQDQDVVMESLALFIRYFLTVNAPLPEADQAARAVGRDRFKAFIDQVGRNLASGTQTLERAKSATSGEPDA
jgi:hypothetical protein